MCSRRRTLMPPLPGHDTSTTTTEAAAAATTWIIIIIVQRKMCLKMEDNFQSDEYDSLPFNRRCKMCFKVHKARS